MITAALPDPSQPSFVLLAAAPGAFVGATFGRLSGAAREDIRRSAEDLAYIATALALAVYVVVAAIQSV
jgi:hypothetical protein